MSVTFHAPEAPTFPVKPFADEPDYSEERSVLPEVNLSNENARAMLDLMGIPAGDLVGKLLPSEMGAVIDRLLRIINDETLRSAAVAPDSVMGGELRASAAEGNVVQLTRMCTVYSMGRTDEYVRRRAGDLLKLFKEARARGYFVQWA